MFIIENFVGELNGKLNHREKFIVLDVEGYSTTRPYNVGYIVGDNYGTIYTKRSFALPSCIWENIHAMINTRQAETMTKKNVEEILTDFENKRTKRKYQNVSVNEFMNIFEKDIAKFKVKKVFAYNVNFDKGSLKRLFGERFNSLGVEFCDIITAILETKLLTKKYCNFCITNNYITEKGNIMTKAEIVYRYLTNDLTFEEEHTGLSDCYIEYFILLTAINTHKKFNTNPTQAWRKLKEFTNTNGIIVPIPTV